MTTTRLVCGCCGVSAEFPTQEAAFEAGWDTPLRFGYAACPLCPAVGAFFPLLFSQQAREEPNLVRSYELQAQAAHWSHSHDAAHDRWTREGRPGSFEESLALGDVESSSVSEERDA